MKKLFCIAIVLASATPLYSMNNSSRKIRNEFDKAVEENDVERLTELLKGFPNNLYERQCVIESFKQELGKALKNND